ncbi:MAG: 16S rRNA (cytosine(1402)-N(4))-methyltransferase, partial [Burkholderiaceae bacterium]
MSAPTSPNAFGHRSVLATPAAEHLLTAPDGIYVDATFGRGGHSRLILSRLAAQGRLIALDRDASAVAAAQAISDPRFHIEHTAFSHLRGTLRSHGIEAVNGVLLDVGVSSPQIDDPQRG